MKKINVTEMMGVYRAYTASDAIILRLIKDMRTGTADERTKEAYTEERRRAEDARRMWAEVSAPLTEAIKEAQGRASARTITAVDIVEAICKIESRLPLTKKAMNGVKVFCDPNAQDFPKAYKYTPESTQFWAEYKSGKWYVTDISRGETMRRSKGLHVYLTEEAKAATIERIESGLLF